MVSSNTVDAVVKQETECEDKQKEKEKKSDTIDHGTVTTPGTLSFVPYHLYSQLLERVNISLYTIIKFYFKIFFHINN